MAEMRVEFNHGFEGNATMFDRIRMTRLLSVEMVNNSADLFNEGITNWNNQWDELYPDAEYVGPGSEYEKIYLGFIREKAQVVVDKLNSMVNDSVYEYCLDEMSQLQVRRKDDHSIICFYYLNNVED